MKTQNATANVRHSQQKIIQNLDRSNRELRRQVETLERQIAKQREGKRMVIHNLGEF